MNECTRDCSAMKWAIVIVGYNRPFALKRVIQSVLDAEYDVKDKVDLIVSLDYSNKQAEQKEYAESVDWKQGKKAVRCFETNQGLKKHVLQCGDLTENYDAVIVLEDDLIVAPSFFDYAKQVAAFYGNDDRIAGISLYSHKTNPGNGRYFEPQYNGLDVFLMQYAQSWGQCWTKQMWRGFRVWLEKQPILNSDYRVPDYVIRWNDKSWLKYHIAYTAMENKFFVYPYCSLSSNNSEIGEHNFASSNAFQVQLSEARQIQYRLKGIDECIKYDAFFERIFDVTVLGFPADQVAIDLYGLKVSYGSAKYLVTTRNVPFEIVKYIRLAFRPHEQNILCPEEGAGIVLCDLNRKGTGGKRRKNSLAIANYDLRAESWLLTLKHGLHGLALSIRYRLKNILKR